MLLAGIAESAAGAQRLSASPRAWSAMTRKGGAWASRTGKASIHASDTWLSIGQLEPGDSPDASNRSAGAHMKTSSMTFWPAASRCRWRSWSRPGKERLRNSFWKNGSLAAALRSPRKPNGLSHCIFECLIVEASSQAQNYLGVLADRDTERCRGVFDCTGDG